MLLLPLLPQHPAGVWNMHMEPENRMFLHALQIRIQKASDKPPPCSTWEPMQWNKSVAGMFRVHTGSPLLLYIQGDTYRAITLA